MSIQDEIKEVLIEYKSKIIGMDYMKFDKMVDKRKYELQLDDQALTAITKIIEEEKTK